MTLRQFVVACFVLLSATSMFAQSGGERKIGSRLRDLDRRMAPPGGVPVTLQLKFDGKNAVSGTISGFRTRAR